MVMVDWPRPEVTKLDPSQMNRSLRAGFWIVEQRVEARLRELACHHATVGTGAHDHEVDRVVGLEPARVHVRDSLP